MSFGLGVLGAGVTLDDSQFVKKLGGLESLSANTFRKIAGLATGYLSFQAIGSFLKSSTLAFQVQEDAIDDLEDALKLSGKSVDNYSGKLQKFASELQKVTSYGDEGTIAVMSMGLNLGVSADRMEDATKAAMGLASAYNMDLKSAMMLIGRASQGQTAMLTRYGIILDKNISKQEQFNQLLEIGKGKFPLAEADTLSKKIQQAKNAWGDMQESVGKFLTKLFSVNSFLDTITKRIQDFTEFLETRMGEIVFITKYMLIEIQAVMKNVWAIFEPVTKFALECIKVVFLYIKTGTEDIMAISMWCANNFFKIWENLPGFFKAIFQDVVDGFMGVSKLIVNLAVNLGKAFWDAIRGKGINGFKEAMKTAADEAVRIFADMGKNTNKAMVEFNLTPMPEFRTVDNKIPEEFKKMLEKYKNILNTVADNDKERLRKLKQLEKEYLESLSKKNKTAEKVDKSKQNEIKTQNSSSAFGAWSVAALRALIGNNSNSPEEKTARNTEKIARGIEDLNRSLGNANQYA